MRKKSKPQRFFKTSLPKMDIVSWVSDVNRFFYPHSIYQLTWKEFHQQLRLNSKISIANHFGYSSPRKLRTAFARADHGFRHCSLDEFRNMSKKHLQICLGEKINQKISFNKNFQLKAHKLSTVHYFLYDRSVHSAAINLGFANKQCFVNFFAQSNYMMDFSVAGLKSSFKGLQTLSPKKFAEELGDIYYHFVIKLSKSFQRYNYSLEELRLLLATEDKGLVIASLGGGNVNYQLKKLVDLGINVNLQNLTTEPLAKLQENTHKKFWQIKLYQLFEWIQVKESSGSFSAMQFKEISPLKRQQSIPAKDSFSVQFSL